MTGTIPTPKYKLGDTVAVKTWFNILQLLEVIGGYWCTSRKEWRYTLTERYPGFFSLRRIASEKDIQLID